MAWCMVDFKCKDPGCGNEFEFLTADPDEAVCCPECEHSAERMLSAPALGFLNNDSERRSASLKKRSEEHTAREQRKGNTASERDMYGGTKKLPKSWK